MTIRETYPVRAAGGMRPGLRTTLVALAAAVALCGPASAQQEPLPWQRGNDTYRGTDRDLPPPVYNGRTDQGADRDQPNYSQGPARRSDDVYRPGPGVADRSYDTRTDDAGPPPPPYRPVPYAENRGYDQPYSPPPYDAGPGYQRDSGPTPYGSVRRYPDDQADGTYSSGEIQSAGHRFFGSISQGLANALEYTFKRQGRPNGYILGEDAGGAFVAGLRYGEGRLYTKDAGTHKVYWQGPSLGYDAGAAGSKVMVLVYNIRDPQEIYERFGGVEGSAYLVGGVSVHFQTRDHVTLAPIRAGIGLRLGASIGYLKYTRRPTWNPF